MVNSWMASLRWFALFIVLVAVCPRAAQSQKFDGRELVTAQLVAETATVVPGQPFTAGLLLKMVPGWHTYWQFPGDAGIPTEIKWKLPEGWKAGPIQWPIPLKLNEPGDIQIYGYHDDVLLMVQLTPPPKIDASSVHLAATADWLVCEKICIPGSGEVQLDLPVGAQTTPANEELFKKFRDRLPRALPAAAGSALQWTRNAKEFRLTISDKSLAQSGDVDFFPLPENSSVVLGHPKRETGPDGSIVFSIPIEAADPGIKSLNGLIVAGDHAFSLGAACRRTRTGSAPVRSSGARRRTACSSSSSSASSAASFSTSCPASSRSSRSRFSGSSSMRATAGRGFLATVSPSAPGSSPGLSGSRP